MLQSSLRIESNDITDLENNIEQLSFICSKSENIHKYTQQIGDHFRFFYTIDNKYHLSTLVNFKDTYTEILNYCNQNGLVKTALDTVLQFSNAISPETQIPVQALLIRTWQLAKTSGYPYAQDLIIDNLSQNKLTGGGCLPGISARLVLPYALYMRQQLQRKLPVISQDVTVNSDLALSLALSESLLSYELYQKSNVNDGFSQEELNLAIQNSLESTLVSEETQFNNESMPISESMPAVIALKVKDSNSFNTETSTPTSYLAQFKGDNAEDCVSKAFALYKEKRTTYRQFRLDLKKTGLTPQAQMQIDQIAKEKMIFCRR